MTNNRLQNLKRATSKKNNPSEENLVKFPIESRKIKDLVGDTVYEILCETDAILAGGALTSIFTSSEVNDLDIYFRKEQNMIQALYEGMEGFNLIYTNTSIRTILLKDSTTTKDVQFMTFKYFPSPEDIFKTFDFTCCMAAYSFKEDAFYLHEDFLKSCSQKILNFNKGTAYPIMSLLRTNKYKERGYTCSKNTLLQILFTCMDLDIDSWEDAKDHIAGLYGLNMDEVFDTSKEFSLQEVVSQLETVQYRDIDSYPINPCASDVWDVLEKVVEVEEIPEPETRVLDWDKYYYKCVDEKWMSPLAPNGKEIKYTKGDVIKGHDIYVHKSPTALGYRSKYWVELEGCDRVNHPCASKIIGDITVVDTFIWEGYDDDISSMQYKIPYKYPELKNVLS